MLQDGQQMYGSLMNCEAVFTFGLLQVEPKGDRVLVKIAEQEQKTRGGILLPVSAQSRPTSGVHVT
jgi:chaperonin GroES